LSFSFDLYELFLSSACLMYLFFRGVISVEFLSNITYDTAGMN